MKRYDMKRKIAAALSLAMLSGCMPFAALAEGEATPSEAQAVLTVSENTQGNVQTKEDAPTLLSDEGSTPGNVFVGASASHTDASLDTASDGTISGSVEFSGAKMVVKLYRDGAQIGDRKLSQSGSFTFTDLAPGSYALRFYFWGEGKLPPQKEISVTVDYKNVEKKDEGGDWPGHGKAIYDCRVPHCLCTEGTPYSPIR